MIRLAIAVILTITALIGLSLRLARDAGTLPPVAGPPPEVRTFDLGRELAEVIDSAVEPAAVNAARPPSAPPVIVDEPAPVVPAVRAVATSARIAEPPVEVEVVPAAGRPFLEDLDPPSADDAPSREDSGSGGNAADEDPEAPTLVARTAADQDEWAALIRRMLTVYRRASTVE